MAKVLFLDDYRAGVHSYYPELGERKPEVKMEKNLCHCSSPPYLIIPARFIQRFSSALFLKR